MRVWLKDFRKKADLTHTGVAEKAEISRSYYTNIENGVKTPTVEVAKSIASALNFSWKRFF